MFELSTLLVAYIFFELFNRSNKSMIKTRFRYIMTTVHRIIILKNKEGYLYYTIMFDIVSTKYK